MCNLGVVTNARLYPGDPITRQLFQWHFRLVARVINRGPSSPLVIHNEVVLLRCFRRRRAQPPIIEIVPLCTNLSKVIFNQARRAIFPLAFWDPFCPELRFDFRLHVIRSVYREGWAIGPM